MFTNNKVQTNEYEDIHKSRFIASWIRSGGNIKTGKDIDDFREWLESMNINEDDISDIVFLATNGKLELEHSASMFLRQKRKQETD